MKRPTFFLLFLLLSVFNLPITAKGMYSFSFRAAVDTIPDFKYQEELKALADRFKERGFNITPLLSDERFEIYETLDDRFEGAAEKTSFTLQEYKDILGFEEKVEKIDEFVAAHFETLSKAEEKYGINKFLIAAILGIESNFGNNIGAHNPFNVYVSMIVLDYRAGFAEPQLKHLLIFTKREEIDVFSLKSSYAGAMGFAQFIPYSLNKWWVGEQLFNMKNNIYSVANYLAYFKERTGDIETTVLRYNPSSLYVDAVLDLAEAAERKYNTTF